MQGKISAILVPALLMVLIICGVAWASYFSPRGPWVVAAYPLSARDPILASAPHVEAIAASSTRNHTVLVRVKNEAERASLRADGAILLDPEGVPLCSR